MMSFKSLHPGYEHLRRKWVAKHRQLTDQLVRKHSDVARQLVAGGVGGALLLSVPATPLLAQRSELASQSQSITKSKDMNQELAEALVGKIPDEVRSLNAQEEQEVAETLSSNLGITVKPELEGIRLNKSYALIGGEQHLYRYPGDTVLKHADNASDWAMYGGSGIAPGLGAWGYFAPSELQFSETDKQRERWYIAVQTFMAPGFAENVARYRDFFKYRKMLVVNPKTGQAVVTDIGDAGPAEYTGKSLGGSPEVMEAVGLAKGPRKGAVIYMFIDDPNNHIPLGPIAMKEHL